MNPLLRSKTLPALLAGLLISCTCAFPALAQQAAPTTADSQADDETVILNVFQVTDSRDVGYSTTNAIGVTRTNTALIDTPQAINVINQAFMQDFQPSEVFDVLQYVPGVSIESNVGDSVMIRGYTVRDHYTNGIIDNQYQSQAGAEPFNFQRLEVLKGPSALVYGSTAIGGVLNRVRKEPLWKEQGEIAVTVGNHGQLKAEFDYTKPINDKVSVRLIATGRDENMVNNVAVKFAYLHRWTATPQVTWKISDRVQLKLVGELLEEKGFKHWGELAMWYPTSTVFGEVELPFGLTKEEGGITTWGVLPRDFTVSSPQGYSRNRKHAPYMYLETQPTDNLAVRLTSTATWWDHEAEDVFPHSGGISYDAAEQAYRIRRGWRDYSDDQFFFTSAVDAVYDLQLASHSHKILAIAQYNQKSLFQNYENLNTGETNYLYLTDDPNYYFSPQMPTYTHARTQRYDHSAAWAIRDHIQFFGDKLQFVAGIRYDDYDTKTNNLLTGQEGELNRGHAYTHRYGAVVKPSRSYSVFFSHATNYTPNYGAQPDGRPFKPLEGILDEVGLKANFFDGRLSGTLSAYDLRMTNIKERDPDPERPGFYIQTARQRTQGLELDMHWQMLESLQVGFGGALQDARLPAPTPPALYNVARNVPRYTASFTTRFAPREGALKGWAAGLGLTWKDAVAAWTTSNYWLPASWSASAWTSYNWKDYKFQLNVMNVTDEWNLTRAVNHYQVFQGPMRVVKFRVSRRF